VTSFAASCVDHVPTPLGSVLVVVSREELVGLYFDGHVRTPRVDHLPDRESPALATVRRQLDEYFAGTRTEFDVPTRLEGSPYQRRVWAALTRVPFASTATYGEIARALGTPGAARAVGAANGRNPISIIIPCHRLLGADGTLTGYGWGLERKRWLLDHERQAAVGIGAVPV
jgi:methylated-DNA-[protein]-cysteine S-methyltransferase